MKNSDNIRGMFNIHDISFMHVISGYTMACMQDGSYELMDMPLRKAESYLSGRAFFRTHKSYLINLHRIKEINLDKGNVSIPINGQSIPVSRRKKKQLFQQIGITT